LLRLAARQPPLSSSAFYSLATATPASYTLPLHDALPICLSCHGSTVAGTFSIAANPVFSILTVPANHIRFGTVRIENTGLAAMRSEEHTSELQSLAYLVCRLLLEKKKHNNTEHRPSLTCV